MSDRVILHCDCNSFFASVETALNPAYRDVPMAVCGSQEARHGIVLAKNELAKKYNIKTAETVYSAKKKCPQLVIAQPHYEEYAIYSRRVNDIYRRYTDMIEPFGIDESWLDVTASQKFFGTGYEIAEKIRQDVKNELGITVSIGVSFNKVFAKLGSDYKKPDAITVINRDNFKDIVYPLPASSLLFVGKRTEDALMRMNIKTVGDLAYASPAMLEARLGKSGEMISRYARGEDNAPVSTKQDEAKSVGNGFTFKHNLVSREECRIGIDYLSEEIGRRLRSIGMKCSTVSLSVKDEYLRTVQRQRPHNPPTDIAREIALLAYEILDDFWSADKPIRQLTVTAQNLVSADSVSDQIDFFDTNSSERRDKEKKREETVEKIRQKYGIGSIVSGAIMSSDIGIEPFELINGDN